MSPHLSRQATSHLITFVIVVLIVQFFSITYVFYQSYEGRVDIVDRQRTGCERGKRDRVDNAAFQRAHAKYIRVVTGAKSVKEDVKSAAREALQTYDRTSTSLTERAKISCALTYPDPGVFP